MTTYHYKARDASGKLVESNMEADSDRAVAARLKQMNCTPVSIYKAKGTASVNKMLGRFRGVRFSDLNMFTRQLYTLQKAGLPLLSGLNALAKQTANKILRDVLEHVAKDIEAGSTFSDALARHPRVFNPLYTNMIKSGEASGRLAETLERLALLGEHEERIRSRIKAATRYPAIVVVAMIIGFLILVTLVIPRFAKIYGQFSIELPIPTQILLGVHYAITKLWWLVIAVVGAFVFLFRQLISTKWGLFWWDGFKLRVFVFGPLMLKLIMSRFCRITGTLMNSGVPILQILGLVSDAVGNTVIAKTINSIKTSVSEGKGMLEPMESSGLFPPIVIEMVAAGEKTGKVDELLLHVSDYYDMQIDYTIDNLVSLIEPVLIFVLASAVLLMALGIFLPMWNMVQLFQR